MTPANLLHYAQTPRQIEVLEAVEKHGSNTKAAKHLGIGRRTVDRIVSAVRQTAVRHGYSPEHDMTHTTPQGYAVRGVSTLYGPDGDIKAQWVKSGIDRAESLMAETISALSEEIKREKPTKPPARTIEDLANLYVITDYHIGAYAWAEETGDDWDISIAEDTLVRWFSAAITQSPNAHTAILANLGDMVHFDGLEALTPTAKNVLDSDTRFQLIVRVIIRVMRRVINMLLQKHDHVHIIMAEGNHDIASSVWLREWFRALYEEEPRITVELSPDPYYCYEHGNTSLFFHHGHLRKPAQIDTVFAAKFRDVFGRTKYSYAHMGHLHSVDVRETNLMLVEQHRTLAAPDAYASRHGWVSGRDAKVITYSKNHGEVARTVVSYDMIQ